MSIRDTLKQYNNYVDKAINIANLYTKIGYEMANVAITKHPNNRNRILSKLTLDGFSGNCPYNEIEFNDNTFFASYEYDEPDFDEYKINLPLDWLDISNTEDLKRSIVKYINTLLDELANQINDENRQLSLDTVKDAPAIERMERKLLKELKAKYEN